MDRSETKQHIDSIMRNVLRDDREEAAKLIIEVRAAVKDEDRLRYQAELTNLIFKAGYSWGCKSTKAFNQAGYRIEPIHSA